MKLCYRGVVHTYYSGSIQGAETKETALFLGNTYQVRQPIYQPKQEKLNLVYRGVAYSTGHTPVQQTDIQQPYSSKYVSKLSVQLGVFN